MSRRPLLPLAPPDARGRRRLLQRTAGAALLAACGAARAQAGGPIRLVVPFPPGGLTDTVGRLLADALQADLGRTVIVDTQPGAAGLIGTQQLAEAAPDGSNWLVTSLSNHVLAPLTQPGARVDPAQDLAPVGLALRTVGVLVCPAALGAGTLADFVAQARARPGALNYASSGLGSANHVQLERFTRLAGIRLLHVPYRGGAPLLSALMAGEVQLALMDVATAEPALASGRVRALAQTGSRRHSALPAVPTLSEAGHAGFDPSFWIGLAAPRATPAPAIAQMNAALGRALGRTALKARAQALGWTLVGGSPQQMAEALARDLRDYRAMVAELPELRR